MTEGRTTSSHIVHVTRMWNVWRVACRGCDLFERYEDETTAHREAQRHERTADA